MKQRLIQRVWMIMLGVVMVIPAADAGDYYNRYGYRGSSSYPGSSSSYRGSPYKPPVPMRRYQPIRKATPDQLLRQGVEQTFSYLRRTGSTDLSNVLDFVNKELGPYFDFEHMTRLATGKMSKDLNDEQIKKLSNKLEEMFMTALGQQIATYAYTNHRVTFYPAKRSRFGKEVSVAARITHPRGFPVKITFRFHPTKNGWKIYDVSANNNSAVMYYRKQLAMIAQRYGMDALLKKTDDKES